MNSACTIQTERLILKEIRESDADLIVRWRSDSNIYQYFKHPHLLTTEEHAKWYKEQYLLDTDIVNWVAYWFDAPVGLFGAKRTQEECAEISYMVSQEARHKGIAAEAVLAIENWMKTEWGIIEVIAEIHKDNLLSVRFIQMLGYTIQREEEKFIIYGKNIS